ncbi:hypothetical protein KIN20_004776 [Parelaphostrongylus tenuis]|uniref:Uncharacterized protein n=1 Tax=Parelaphostrongylus tenuis TaxID=148309 RepID=A0AAD5QFF9_PARTN|nr:hypothetical protein KIN20_004776 [Parelaphostrongylus tenuis]
MLAGTNLIALEWIVTEGTNENRSTIVQGSSCILEKLRNDTGPPETCVKENVVDANSLCVIHITRFVRCNDYEDQHGGE